MDDVAELKKIGAEESFVFIVNSSQRDTNVWPTPSEYTIEFDRPFQNVVGFDVLHAIVPRTEYVVDEGFNKLTYTVASETKTVVVEPGDMNLIQLCEALNFAMTGGVSAEPHSSPYQIRSRIRFVSRDPFTIDAANSSMAKLLGFYDGTMTYPSALSGLIEERAFMSVFPGLDYEDMQQEQSVRQAFVPGVSGLASKIVVFCTEQSILDCKIVDSNGAIYGTGTIVGSQAPEIGLVDGLPLTVGQTYYVVITCSSETAGVYRGVPLDGVVGAEVLEPPPEEEEEDPPPPEEEEDPPPPAEEEEVWAALTSSDALAIEVYVSVERHEVSGPGLVDLTGTSLVVIRCPEIESRFHRSRRTERFHGGIGMLRMQCNGFAENKFESFPARKLVEPIGKLKSLSFRLETVGGETYKARGVDHSLVCVVRYLTMEQQNTSPSILNPNYTPNITDYLAQKWRAELEQQEQLRLRKQREVSSFAGSIRGHNM